VADIRQGSTSVYDNGLVVGSDAANPLDILLSTAQGSVEGSVIGADQKPASRVTVVLIPPEQRRQNSALYKTMLSGIDGRYVFNNVPAGNYTVYAWESVPARAYQNAEFLARFAGRGKLVTIQAGAPATADVNVIPKDPGR
jgi:hypothetical protein